MKRKHQPPIPADGRKLGSQSASNERIVHSQKKDVPLSAVFARLLHGITNKTVSSRFQTQVRVSNPTNKRGVLENILNSAYIFIYGC